MPKADEPRHTVRFSRVDNAILEAASEQAGVAVGSMIREGALRNAREVAGEVSAAAPKMRRRSAAVPVPSPAASSEVEKSEPPVLDAVSPSDGRGKISHPVRRVPQLPGVMTAKDLMLERQRKMNERRGP
jgi:hypothetical protein